MDEMIAKELIKDEIRNGNLPSQELATLYKKVKYSYLVVKADSGYDKTLYQAVARGQGRKLDNAFSGERFYMGWCGTGLGSARNIVQNHIKEFNLRAIKKWEVRRPTYGEFLTWVYELRAERHPKNIKFWGVSVPPGNERVVIGKVGV